MALSAFDLYSVGIGPSSSHTVGPMRAANMFVTGLDDDGRLAEVARVEVNLYGSLGATGKGHGTPKAVLLGLEGEDPATVDTTTGDARIEAMVAGGRLHLLGRHEIAYSPDDVILHLRTSLPGHPNGMTFTAFRADGAEIRLRTYYSVGGGFVVDDGANGAADGLDRIVADDTTVRYPFSSGDELLAICAEHDLSFSDVMLANEQAWRTEAEVREGMLYRWQVMVACVEAGCTTEGILPGGLRVPRRAPALHRRLAEPTTGNDPLHIIDFVNLYALAVNEENAAGGRVVTAPTNGAAGIVPAVLHYYVRFVPGADDDGIVRFLLTAAAIGILFKTNASISGAEVGCQGEVGSACSMAAGALCERFGGTPAQVENAAEVGIEHNLGLTCDPVGGLVQIPCIERNAMASVKAVNAARLAMHGDGSHKVSLDKAIKTMRDTGRDMKKKYKETSRGGLAVNVIEC
ncbi:MAG: L-serine ammonia-lyase [Acidimicrobiia bacterium]|nr:L-serine ammonia-lyase [Acidimicrobiia bacterium]MDH5521902.1 L-serine ammonia-lyase [Acidimicrobiia bacterium]